MKKISIINGPNLNLIGERQTELYGNKSLHEINQDLINFFDNKAKLNFFQSNHEGAIIDFIHNMEKKFCLVINPGAFTHTSIAIRDAILARDLLAIEVHLSNIYKREAFRKVSYFSDISLGVIYGLGPLGYRFAIEALLNQKNNE